MSNGRSFTWLKRFAVFLMFSASTATAVSAQTAPGAQPRLETVLIPGKTVWITDSAGREQKTRILSVSRDVVTAAAGDDIRRLRTTEVKRVRARQSDSLLNGALIGAGAAVASGLFVCTRMEPWENCRDDVGPMLQIGAIGAGIGIGVDALIRGRRTIYEAPRESVRLGAAPYRWPSRRGTAGLSQFLTARVPRPERLLQGHVRCLDVLDLASPRLALCQTQPSGRHHM